MAKRERYLLDTSAILTLLEDEKGAERAESLLRDAESEVLLPFLALLETYYVAFQEPHTKQRGACF